MFFTVIFVFQTRNNSSGRKKQYNWKLQKKCSCINTNLILKKKTAILEFVLLYTKLKINRMQTNFKKMFGVNDR